MDLKNQPPSSKRLKALLEQKEKERATKAKQALDHLKQCANAVAASDEGRILLRYLSHVCGFGKTKVVADMQSKTVDPISTTFNAAMENVYLQVRKLIRREHLIKIEHKKQEEI